MAMDDKMKLKERVLQFVDQQNLGEGPCPIRIVCDECNLYFILYGTNLATGITGLSETADGAFNDFKDNWFRYRSIKESAISSDTEEY